MYIHEPESVADALTETWSHHVLAVDDDPEILATLRSTLEPNGIRLTCVDSVAAAQAALATDAFDLILTDLYLGEEHLGYEIAALAHERSPRIPVVLLTGRPSFRGAVEAMRTQVAEILVKPVNPHLIVSTIRRTIHEAALRRRTDELEAQNQVLAEVLPRAIEIKDPITSGHATRVVRYVDSLAKRCGLGPEDRDSLRMASLFHDVGKIGIPDSILQKPARLTAEERKVIEKHPQWGYEILEPMKGVGDMRLWVYQHHERWDGKGYPNGLQGEDVALPGRILMLAEVFDALAERRSYKEAWPVPRIARFFREQAGLQFDPDLSHIVADGLEAEGARFFASAPGMLF